MLEQELKDNPSVFFAAKHIKEILGKSPSVYFMNRADLLELKGIIEDAEARDLSRSLHG